MASTTTVATSSAATASFAHFRDTVGDSCVIEDYCKILFRFSSKKLMKWLDLKKGMKNQLLLLISFKVLIRQKMILQNAEGRISNLVKSLHIWYK
jgi:hypothetical protein